MNEENSILDQVGSAVAISDTYIVADKITEPTEIVRKLKKRHEDIAKKWLRAVFVLWLILLVASGHAYWEFAIQRLPLALNEAFLHFMVVSPLIAAVWFSLFRFNRSNFLVDYYTHLEFSLAFLPAVSSTLEEAQISAVLSDLTLFPETKNKKLSNKTIDSSFSLAEKLIDKIPTPK